jgi:hypothetical protein
MLTVIELHDIPCIMYIFLASNGGRYLEFWMAAQKDVFDSV